MRLAPREARRLDIFLRGGGWRVSSPGGTGSVELSSDHRDFQELEARLSLGERLRRVPRAVRLVVLVSGGALLVSAALSLALWAQGAAARADALGRELDRTRMSIAALEKANELLRAEIGGLRDDPRVIEKAVREVLGVVRAGEVVVYLDAAPASDPARATPAPTAPAPAPADRDAP